MLPPPLVVSPASAGDGLSGLLEVYLALEEARAERSRQVHLNGLCSVPLAVLALWPSLFSDVGRRAVLTLWSFSAIAVLWALAIEWRLLARTKASVNG